MKLTYAEKRGGNYVEKHLKNAIAYQARKISLGLCGKCGTNKIQKNSIRWCSKCLTRGRLRQRKQGKNLWTCKTEINPTGK